MNEEELAKWTADHERRYKLQRKLKASILLGYTSEDAGPETFGRPMGDIEADWLAYWLLGEGWTHE